MANKKQELAKMEIIQPNDNLFQLKRVHFIKDIPIFLNYVNKLDGQFYELVIKTPPNSDTCFLFIKDKKTKEICLVPLTSVASADLS